VYDRYFCKSEESDPTYTSANGAANKLADSQPTCQSLNNLIKLQDASVLCWQGISSA